MLLEACLLLGLVGSMVTVPDSPPVPPLKPDRFQIKDLDGLRQTIRLNEDVRFRPYLDKGGKLTVGVGFNLSQRKDLREKFKMAGIDAADLLINKVPLTPNQVDTLLNETIIDALADVRTLVPDFDNLSAGRQNALADMSFQLGLTRMSKFKRMLNAVNNKNWPKAAEQLLDSKMALVQTPNRARRNATKLLGGPIQKIAQPFFNPRDPKTGATLPDFDNPILAPREGFVDIPPIPSPKLQKKFDANLLQQLQGLPLGDLGSIALNMEVITEVALEAISRKDLIVLIFGNLTLAAPSKGV